MAERPTGYQDAGRYGGLGGLTGGAGYPGAYSGASGGADALANLGANLASDFRASLDARGGGLKVTPGPGLDGTGDAFSSLLSPRRAAGAAPTNAADQSTSSAGLRDRLLREARSERQRCLEVAGVATRSLGTDPGCHKAVQTDPVTIIEPGSTSGVATPPRIGTPTAANRSPAPASADPWGSSDDAAQAEALRALQTLGERGFQSRYTESRVTEIEAELRAERAGRQELDTNLAHERGRKEAAQQQVLCLEHELDGKEAALQVAERALDRRDADLQQATLQLQALQAERGRSFQQQQHLGGHAALDDPRSRALVAQVIEREHQLEQKDQHIQRLLGMLRQQGSTFLEEASTVYGSERSAVTASTGFTRQSYH